MTLRQIRAAAAALAVLGAGLTLSGCLGPTYGTGKSTGAQLFDDIDGMLALGSRKDGPPIDYAPRAELVKPAEIGRLPQPQQKVDATRDPNWPESPEQRSARIKAAADAQATDGPVPVDIMLADKEGIEPEQLAANTRPAGFQSGSGGSTPLTPEELNGGSEAFKARLRESKQGMPSQRKYLSEPPLAYRQPAASAPAGDPGIDESVKEAKYKKNTGLGEKIRGLLPF